MAVRSTLAGSAVSAFPDVCKTPAPAGPVPIPYPNIGLSAARTRVPQLRGQLQLLHMQLMGMPGANPNQWHQLLDRYVILTAELYSTLAVE